MVGGGGGGRKRYRNKYLNGVPTSKMSDVKNIYFISFFQTHIPKWLDIHKIAGQNPGPFSRRLEMCLCQPSSRWVPFE